MLTLSGRIFSSHLCSGYSAALSDGAGAAGTAAVAGAALTDGAGAAGAAAVAGAALSDGAGAACAAAVARAALSDGAALAALQGQSLSYALDKMYPG